MTQKERLDVLLVSRGLAESREKAQGLIMAGLVSVDGEVADKAGEKFGKDAQLSLKGKAIPYVSRGGLKLEQALRHFGIDVSGKTVIDIGASTGGFTDCLLQHGASFVYAVDVGYGQIHQKLRDDPRVHVMERVNARYLTAQDIPNTPQALTMDVSFISIKKIIPVVAPLLDREADLIVLVKPQFEAGRSKVLKGVVRDRNTHEAVLEDIWNHFLEQAIWVLGLWYSPVTGPEGNIEFLLYAKRGYNSQNPKSPVADSKLIIKQVVSEAHEHLLAKQAGV